MDSAPEPGSRPGIRRILLATDLSPTSAAAAEQALTLASDLGASLLIVSDIDPEAGPGTGRLFARMDQRRAAREAAAQSLVVDGRRRGVRVSFLVWEGEPGSAIVDAAASEAADLIIVGTHGRSRVGRMVLGSVSDYVVRHAPCPVLIARS
jgi:nucleotide-binding universal stress UspA family protein